jgi:predicted nucleic acid-binding protein
VSSTIFATIVIPIGPPVPLIDTSAWIEFLRDTDSPACEVVDAAIRNQTAILTDPVLLELMSGARSKDRDQLLRFLNEQDYAPVAPRADWLDAAEIYAGCRRSGITLRSQLDCLIASVAIRNDVALVHHDRDFDDIAAVTTLRVA